MFNNHPKHKPRGIHFEIIPMIDVMMILVLFLSVMAFLPQVQSSIKPDVPKGNDEGDVTGDDIILTMKSSPQNNQPSLSLNDESISNDDNELFTKIQSALQKKPEGRVVIAADKTLSYDVVIQMLIKLKRAKISNVVLATSKE